MRSSARGCGLLATLAAVVLGCERHTALPPAPSTPAPRAPMAQTTSAPPQPVAVEEPEDLEEEAQEADPRSEQVEIKLAVSPAVPAAVYWGRKKLGDVRPSDSVVEMRRPRGSGPLDLVVRGDGFLPHHVRVFTDRDDRISIRLVRPGDASGLLGGRRLRVDAGQP